MMNARRWFGALLLVGSLVVLGVGAYGQEKDKTKGKTDAVPDKSKEKDKAKTDAVPDKSKDKDKGKTETAPVPDKGQIKLVLKAFEPKSPKFYQEMTTKTTQVMKVMMMEVTQVQDQTFWISWEPQEKKDGNLVVKQKIIGLKMKIEIGGNTIAYDSTAKEQSNNPLTDFFKALKDTEFTIYINEDAKSDKYMMVSKVEGREGFISKLAAANMQLEPLLKRILSEEALKSMAEPAFGIVPPKGEIPSDKKWTRENKLDMGPIGTYETSYSYSFKDKTDNIANIDVATNLKYVAPKEGTMKNELPFKILKADLVSKDGKGTVHFDLEKGRVKDCKMESKLEGKLSIEIGGMATDVELNQTQTSVLTSMDADPTVKK